MTQPNDPINDPIRPTGQADPIATREETVTKKVEPATTERRTTVTETRKAAEPVHGAHTVGEKRKFPWWVLIPIALLIAALAWAFWPKDDPKPVETTAVVTTTAPAVTTTAPATTSAATTSAASATSSAASTMSSSMATSASASASR